MNWQPLNLNADEFAKPAEPPALLGLVYAGKRHTLSGPPETLKTLVALCFAIEAMRAGQVAAFIDFESGPAETRRLLEDLGATRDEIGALLYYEPEGPPDPSDILELLEAGTKLVVIDAAAGAYTVSGLDDNKRDDAERFARAWIQPLWQAGVTTLLIDHVTKNAESRGRFTIGSERKLGTQDVHLQLESIHTLSRGTRGLLKVRTHKDRPGFLRRPYAAEIDLASDPETHAITWAIREPATSTATGDHWQPTYLMQKVSEYLAEQQFGASRNEIQKAVRGKSNDAKRQAIDELIADGYATETPGARGAKIIQHVRPYTSPDFASTSPGEVTTTSPTSPPSIGARCEARSSGEVNGHNGSGEVDDALEQLLVDHADIANGRRT